MNIKKQYLQKYLHKIAIDQIADEYTKMGFQVSKEEALGKRYTADIIARKGTEAIVIEVKSGPMTPEQREKLKDLADYVRERGEYKFQVAIAKPPKEKAIEIEGIEQLLTLWMLEHLPDELDQLSSHTFIEEVADIEIDEIMIKKSLIYVSGAGIVEVELQYGSDSDQLTGDGMKAGDSFPFNFDITLAFNRDMKLFIEEVNELKVDTSSYY